MRLLIARNPHSGGWSVRPARCLVLAAISSRQETLEGAAALAIQRGSSSQHSAHSTARLDLPLFKAAHFLERHPHYHWHLIAPLGRVIRHVLIYDRRRLLIGHLALIRADSQIN